MRYLLFILMFASIGYSQLPPIEPGVSHELAKWRAVQYSNISYKLNLTLEKMSPVLKGSLEIRVNVSLIPQIPRGSHSGEPLEPIILDWRKIAGHEDASTVSNVSLNGTQLQRPRAASDELDSRMVPRYEESNEHLIFREGVKMGENVIKLDFTSPILTSGSAITRYVDKEDGAEYIYSLFVPSDASTAFPVFDQPDLKARFALSLTTPEDWKVVTNTNSNRVDYYDYAGAPNGPPTKSKRGHGFEETKPISTYVFAFAAGDFAVFGDGVSSPSFSAGAHTREDEVMSVNGMETSTRKVYVRKSQAAKFKPHAAEVFRLTREGVKYLESYFDYKFPFPKYDIVLIPEFPFGGMEHAGATFLREASVIFPQEPTKNDYISRANLIFHETAHQWFGDTVTMKWFDDLWLKEGFAEFMAYKTLESVMPESNAWKVFYERNKQAAYLTDSTKGTTPIYQEIANLSAAKSAYGNIVYRKTPSFLRQAEFYLGEDKFQTAVRSFLKKHEYANAGWEDLVKEFEAVSGQGLKQWATQWVTQPGVPKLQVGSEESSTQIGVYSTHFELRQRFAPDVHKPSLQKLKIMMLPANDKTKVVRDIGFGNNIDTGGDSRGYFGKTFLIVQPPQNNPYIRRPSQSARDFEPAQPGWDALHSASYPTLIFPNYGDYGYGIFLLDDKSRDYVLKNIQNEKDDFLRTMMWGSLWDSVREGELDPKEYVELVVKNLSLPATATNPKRLSTTPSAAAASTPPGQGGEQDEGTIQTLLGRVSTAMNYYIDTKAVPPASAGGTNSTIKPTSSKQSTSTPGALPPANAGGNALVTTLENLLIDKMQNASTPGQKITYYRSFLSIASTARARDILKQILAASHRPAVAAGSGRQPLDSVKRDPGKPSPPSPSPQTPVEEGVDKAPPMRTKDRFDIVAKLISLGDPEAPRLLAELEKAETSDDARRYAYAAKAGFATAENKAKYWADYIGNKDISESWIEASLGPFNSVRQSDLTVGYLQKALAELPNLKRSRKIFFVNGWLGAFIGGQKSEAALAVINKFLADNPGLDNDLRLKILENADLIERAVKIRAKFGRN